MTITASVVKELRDKTGAGMMDAKKALTENGGDMEAATDWLRTRGLAKAAKKSGRTAAEGLVAVVVDGGVGAVVEVNSETDFVARNTEFQDMVGKISKSALKVGDLAELAAADMGGKTVSEVVTDKVATIGENMTLRRMAKLDGEVIASYVHGAVAEGMGKIGVLVAISGGDASAAAEVGKQVAMHVAASNPVALSADDLDPALVEREKKILADQAKESGKPDDVVEKMVAGRMNKFHQEVCLLKQSFVVNPDHTVEKAVEEAAPGAKVTGFIRYETGEGIETEKEDFAAEVAKTMGA